MSAASNGGTELLTLEGRERMISIARWYTALFNESGHDTALAELIERCSYAEDALIHHGYGKPLCRCDWCKK